MADVIPLISGLAALGVSLWLLWDVSADFSSWGAIMEKYAGTPAGRIALGKIVLGYHLKMLGAWALAVVAGVLLS